MPAARVNIWDLVNAPSNKGTTTKINTNAPGQLPLISRATCTNSTRTDTKTQEVQPAGIYFPRTEAERTSFRTKDSKRVTRHQWAVYDYILNIPKGNVTTYKSVCNGLGQGSPRSVGSALRINPFAPYVPCHRIISSDLYLGGYCGEWGPQSKTGTQYYRKLQLLRDEGIEFEDNGMLRSRDKLL
ncbi:methylated-DNA- [Rhizoctonia solani AG-1 IB]|uniref:Methylated-DNA--protein-cysteine methyltransferase n=1 Tax=Thanatephorus cucumeris (strain AG1-IB / isolate 7/3/14) TaxID=1108050 RepID=A0A0B7G184_THACB|nr:methylated-DNA- [Rhizoctonia solani AG-1 IB]